MRNRTRHFGSLTIYTYKDLPGVAEIEILNNSVELKLPQVTKLINYLISIEEDLEEEKRNAKR